MTSLAWTTGTWNGCQTRETSEGACPLAFALVPIQRSISDTCNCISDSLISSGDPGVQPADTTSSAEIKKDPLDPFFDVDHDSGLKNRVLL